MPDSTARIFVSYARRDGEDFAHELRRKLIAEFGEEQIWRDRDRMEGGVNWWKQITTALDNVEYMVLVATPAAMASDVVKKEWRYARQQGVCVYPVQVTDLLIDFDALPRWMSDGHFYDLDKEWTTFIRHLHSKCDTVRVPFYGVPDLPDHFVQRPDVFEPMKAQLLDESRDNPVAITTSLVGAGSFGKTTLAAALCHDDDVQTAFDDGVLWVTLGENPSLPLIFNGLYRTLTGEQALAETVHEAAANFSEKLADNDILLVIDDIGESAHVKRFLQGGERCARLMTTRFSNIAFDANAQQNDVDEMSTSESVALLLSGIQPPPDDRAPFEALAERLGEWALMLDVTNGTLRKRMSYGAHLDSALAYVNKALDKRGVSVLKTGSNDAAVQVLDTSIEQLDSGQRPRLYELAIFVEDTAIPLTSVMALWNMDDFDTEELIELFADLSFVKFDAEIQIIRLHDVVREVLATKLQAKQSLSEVHRHLIDNYGNLTDLPDEYAWRNIVYHLNEADRLDTLRELLLTFDYLQNKLNATDLNASLADIDALDSDDALRLLQSALSNSSHILSCDAAALGQQLCGRLGYMDDPAIVTLLTQIPESPLAPTRPWLNPAGGALQRTFDGDVDGSLRATLEGHSDTVSGVLEHSSGYLVSWSSDHTLRVWRLDGSLRTTLEGHTDAIWGVLEHSSGQLVSRAGNLTTRLSDNTVRVWGVDGSLRAMLEGHTDVIWGVLEQSSGQLVTWSRGQPRVWGVDGSLRATLDGHSAFVQGVLEHSSGQLVSWSNDDTLRVWGVDGCLHATFEGHTGSIKGVLEHSSGHLVSWSVDQTLRVWDLDSNEIIERDDVGNTNVHELKLAVTVPERSELVQGHLCQRHYPHRHRHSDHPYRDD